MKDSDPERTHHVIPLDRVEKKGQKAGYGDRNQNSGSHRGPRVTGKGGTRELSGAKVMPGMVVTTRYPKDLRILSYVS